MRATLYVYFGAVNSTLTKQKEKRMKKLFYYFVAVLIAISSVVPSSVHAAEDSQARVIVYDDLNGNGIPEDNEKVSVDVQFAHVAKACADVNSSDLMSGISAVKSPFTIASPTQTPFICVYFLIDGRGTLSKSNYDVRTTMSNMNIQLLNIYIMRFCECNLYIPVAIRAWSG